MLAYVAATFVENVLTKAMLHAAVPLSNRSECVDLILQGTLRVDSSTSLLESRTMHIVSLCVAAVVTLCLLLIGVASYTGASVRLRARNLEARNMQACNDSADTPSIASCDRRASGQSQQDPYASGQSQRDPYASGQSQRDPYASGQSQHDPYASGQSQHAPPLAIPGSSVVPEIQSLPFQGDGPHVACADADHWDLPRRQSI
jgi:hypothetical protein